MKTKYLLCGLLLASSLPLMAHNQEGAGQTQNGQWQNQDEERETEDEERENEDEERENEDGQWQTIPVAAQMQITDDQGQPRTINPACAFDTVPNPNDGPPIDNSYQFYFKQGESKNLLVYFNGGGSCWNDATCVASLGLGNVPGARPTYNPSMLIENSPVEAGGVFDDGNKENPFKDWSKVFIPYCTGDLHAGSKDVTYTDVDGSITGYPGTPVVVKHRGFDNFMAVREWMKNKFSDKKSKVKKLLVAGSSAGGYGATLNFPYVQAAFPKVEAALFSDSSASIGTEGFVNDVFVLGSNWDLENTLPPIFASNLGTYTAAGLNVDLFQRLSQAYPKNRFAQYSTAQDAVQVFFLKIMDQIDQGNTNPYTWDLGPSDFLYFAEWNARMTASFDYLSDNTNNYQYYIGAGSVHIVLNDDFATAELPHPFYDQHSAQGVVFSEWLAEFATTKKFKDRSVKYVQ